MKHYPARRYAVLPVANDSFRPPSRRLRRDDLMLLAIVALVLLGAVVEGWN